MTFFFEKDINICFFSNENASCRKSYTSYYALKVTSIDNHSFAKDDQFYFLDF